MPTYVDPKRCKNNARCMEICPSDIMVVNKQTNFAYNLEPDMCWECFTCVKTCPEHAISIRPYADISPYLSEVTVLRDEATNRIKWEIRYRDQQTVKSFEFVIRTTPWGSILIPQGPDPSDPGLRTELLEGESTEVLRAGASERPHHPGGTPGRVP